MMRKYLGIAVLALLVMALGAAYADPIPGSINELENWNFEQVDATGAHVWGAWEHSAGMTLVQDGVEHGWAASCKSAGADLWIRQVVDETKNPLWDWRYHQKEIDLMADIRVTWFPEQGGPVHPTSRIKFGLDWWGEEWNQVSDPSQLPAPEHYAWSGWYDFTDNGVWSTVNPWDDDSWVLTDDGHVIQPRWVSVEIVIEQAGGEEVWVDNVVLTSKCIPEPMSIILGCLGLSSVAGLRRFIRK